MIRAGIIGGAGYTAGELIRILLNHPETELAFVHSTSNAGNRLWEVHSGLFGDTDMRFSAEYDLNAVDVVFMCSGHGKSTAFWAENARPSGLKVIDLHTLYANDGDKMLADGIHPDDKGARRMAQIIAEELKK